MNSEQCDFVKVRLLLLWFRFGAFLASFVLVEGKVVGLFAQKALSLIGQIFAGFDGFFAGEIEWLLARKRFKCSEPVLRLIGQWLERSTNIGVPVGVLIEVGAELVHKVGDILQFIVKALGACFGLGAIGEAFDGVDVIIENSV